MFNINNKIIYTNNVMKQIDLKAVDVQGLTAQKVVAMIKTARDNACLNHPMLSENELKALFDVFNGLMLSQWSLENFAMADDMSDADTDGMISQKWGIDVQSLCEKLENMSEDETAEVIKRIGAFWLDAYDYEGFAESISKGGYCLFLDYKQFMGIDYSILKFFLKGYGVESDILYRLDSENGEYAILSLTEKIDDSE